MASPGPTPAKRRSKAPLVVGLTVLALLVVGGLVVAALAVLGGDPEPGDAVEAVAHEVQDAMAAQTDLADAIEAADVDALEELRGEIPDATPIDLGVETSGSLNRSGLAALSFEASADEAYTVTAALVGGDEDVAVAAVPADGPVVAPAAVVDAGVDGLVTVVLAVPGESGADLTVRVTPIEIVPVDVAVDQVFDGEIAEPGDVAVYTVATEAGDPYIVDVDNDDLTITVVGPDGASVELTTDPTVDEPRFAAATEGPYRVQISGGTDGVTGSYSLEIYKVPDYYFFYDSDDPELVIDTTVEQFQPLVDGDDNRAHVCLYLREGITMNLDIAPTTLELDMGIDVFDETESGALIARVNENGPGIPETWSVTANDDVIRCFQLWGVDYTGGGFDVRFTTSG